MNATQCRVCTLPKHNMETTISAINRSARCVLIAHGSFVCLLDATHCPQRGLPYATYQLITHWCKHVPSSSNSTKKGIKYKKKSYIYIPEKNLISALVIPMKRHARSLRQFAVVSFSPSANDAQECIPMHMKPFRQPAWLHNAWPDVRSTSNPGKIFVWGRKRPHAVFRSTPCHLGKSAWDVVVDTIICQVFRCKPTTASSADSPRSVAQVFKTFWAVGWTSSSELSEMMRTWKSWQLNSSPSDTSSSCWGTSAMHCKLDLVLNKKNFHSVTSTSFLNFSGWIEAQSVVIGLLGSKGWRGATLVMLWKLTQLEHGGFLVCHLESKVGRSFGLAYVYHEPSYPPQGGWLGCPGQRCCFELFTE